MYTHINIIYIYIYTYKIMQCHVVIELAEEWLCQDVFDEETTRIDWVAQWYSWWCDWGQS